MVEVPATDIFWENAPMKEYLLLGIKLRLLRRMTRNTQQGMAQKFGLPLPAYKKIEEGQNAPDSENTLKLSAAVHLDPRDAVTKVSKEVADLLLGVSDKEAA